MSRRAKKRRAQRREQWQAKWQDRSRYGLSENGPTWAVFPPYENTVDMDDLEYIRWVARVMTAAGEGIETYEAFCVQLAEGIDGGTIILHQRADGAWAQIIDDCCYFQERPQELSELIAEIDAMPLQKPIRSNVLTGDTAA